MMKNFRKILALALTVVSVLTMSGNVFAAEILPAETEEYLIINGEQVVHAYEDYENPETGEYVHWTTNVNARGSVVKTFSYKIRYSITSSKFKVGSTSVKVSTNAHVEDVNGNYASGYTGHAYQVQVTGVYSRNLYFKIGGTTSGTINGLKNGGSYSVTVINNDYLSDYYYLVGTGSIFNN